MAPLHGVHDYSSTGVSSPAELEFFLTSTAPSGTHHGVAAAAAAAAASSATATAPDSTASFAFALNKSKASETFGELG